MFTLFLGIKINNFLDLTFSQLYKYLISISRYPIIQIFDYPDQNRSYTAYV